MATQSLGPWQFDLSELLLCDAPLIVTTLGRLNRGFERSNSWLENLLGAVKIDLGLFMQLKIFSGLAQIKKGVFECEARGVSGWPSNLCDRKFKVSSRSPDYTIPAFPVSPLPAYSCEIPRVGGRPLAPSVNVGVAERLPTDNTDFVWIELMEAPG